MNEKRIRTVANKIANSLCPVIVSIDRQENIINFKILRYDMSIGFSKKADRYPYKIKFKNKSGEQVHESTRSLIKAINIVKFIKDCKKESSLI